jgi:hypothetical protein
VEGWFGKAFEWTFSSKNERDDVSADRQLDIVYLQSDWWLNKER